MSALTVKNLSAGYGRKTIISDINLEAGAGQLIALLGPNGSGKTTLIKTLAGLMPKKDGDIWVGDTPLDFLEPKIRARKIAYLAQSRQAMPDMTVLDILELGRAPYRGRLGTISRAGRTAIDQVIMACALETFLTRKFSALSGGEQARVLLGRVLAVDASVILVDEPIAALDPYFQLATLRILKAEAARGKTIIAALHDLSLAQRFSDHIWIMSSGEVVSDTSVERSFGTDIIEEVFNINWDEYRT